MAFTESPDAHELHRRRRKANFSSEEVDVLMAEVFRRKHILFNSPRHLNKVPMSSAEKLAAWRAVAAKVNLVSPGADRTAREVRKKWGNVSSSFRKRQMGDIPQLEPHMLLDHNGRGEVGKPTSSQYITSRLRRASAEFEIIPVSVNNENTDSDDDDDDDDFILGIQPDVHIESSETPLTFPDVADTNSQTESSKQSFAESWQGVQSGINGEATRQNGFNEHLQKKLQSGEVVISKSTKRTTELSDSHTSTNSTVETADKSYSVEEEKLFVLKEILKVQKKRLKIEKKRLKIEYFNYRMLQKKQTK